jgi:uncharacterized protein (DUF4415 family)
MPKLEPGTIVPSALERPKAQVTMRIDADVLDALKASGPAWQSRVNDLLASAVKRGRI